MGVHLPLPRNRNRDSQESGRNRVDSLMREARTPGSEVRRSAAVNALRRLATGSSEEREAAPTVTERV